MKKQLTENLKGVFFLLIPFCLFSPWVSIRDTCFFQGVKSCDLILVLFFYLIIVFMGYYWRNKILCFTLSKLDIIILFYGSYLTFLAFLSWNRLDREVLLMHVACGLLYVAARNVTERQIRQMLVVFPLLLVWQLWYGIVKQTDYFYPGKGMELVCGSFLNTGLWSCFVACAGVLFCGQVSLSRSWWVKGIHGLGVFLSVGLLYVANSRAAWLGFGVGCGYLLYKSMNKIHKVARWLLIIVLVGILVGAGVSTRHKEDSALGRMLIWKIAGQMCLERPLGRGLDGFRRDYMGYQQKYFEKSGSSTERMLADENLFAFNDLLRILVEQGVIGVLLTLALVYAIFKPSKFRESDSGLLRVLRGVVLVWLVFSLFSYPASRLQVKGVFIMFVAMLSSLDARVWSFNGKWIAVPGVVGVLLVSVLEVYPFRRAVETWNTCCRNWEVLPEYPCSVLSPLMNTPEVLPNCALFLNKKGETEVAAKVADRGVRLYHSYGCCIELGIALERQGKLQLAEEVWGNAENLIPNRFKPLFLQMEMWEKAGNGGKAVELAERLLNKQVKVMSPELSYYLNRAKQIKLTFKTKCL